MRVVSTVVFVSTPYKHGTQMSKDSLQHGNSAGLIKFSAMYRKGRKRTCYSGL